MISDICSLSSSFLHIEWSHIRREGNALAHQIAKHVSVEGEAHWIGTVPIKSASIAEIDRERLTVTT